MRKRAVKKAPACVSKRTAGSCRRTDAYDDSPKTLAQVVSQYKRYYAKGGGRERKFYANQPDIDTAIKLAANARIASGKRHPHHYRRSAATLKRVHAKLKLYDLELCCDFDELHDAITEAIGDIHEVGPLLIYDTAQCIGWYLELEPERVYLHSGTRAGAYALGLGHGRDTIEVNELPKPFRRLTASQIEDCLCIYKTELENICG